MSASDIKQQAQCSCFTNVAEHEIEAGVAWPMDEVFNLFAASSKPAATFTAGRLQHALDLSHFSTLQVDKTQSKQQPMSQQTAGELPHAFEAIERHDWIALKLMRAVVSSHGRGMQSSPNAHRKHIPEITGLT